MYQYQPLDTTDFKHHPLFHFNYEKRVPVFFGKLVAGTINWGLQGESDCLSDLTKLGRLIDALNKLPENIKDDCSGICFNWQHNYNICNSTCYKLIEAYTGGSFPISNTKGGKNPIWQGDQLEARLILIAHMQRILGHIYYYTF